MDTMARKKKSGEAQEAAKPAAQRSGMPIHVWVDEDLARAFTAYIESTEPRVFRTAAVEVALKDFLRKKGFWPPKP